MDHPAPQKFAKSSASFAIPRAAIDALIDSQADVVTIAAYLTLACHTEKTGRFSTAGLKAIRDNLSINRKRAEEAIQHLSGINAVFTAPSVHDDLPAKGGKQTKKEESAPLVYIRDTWLRLKGGELPDGPHPRAKVLHVLPTFGVPLKDRVWIGSGLVRGDGMIDKPLKLLKDCGDVAARLLLAMYAGQDLDRWGGVPPFGYPWQYYKLEEETHSNIKVLYASSQFAVGPNPLFERIKPREESMNGFKGLDALESCGLLYEAVVLLNRNPIPDKCRNGDAYGDIPRDADIVCDLGSPSPYGPESPVEQGLGSAYVQTMKDLNLDDRRSYDYLAVVPRNRPTMIAGLYRLRFRVTHSKNAFIEESARRHLDWNQDALRKLNYLRTTKKLAPIRTLQSSSIPFQSNSMGFNPVQYHIHGEGESRGETPIDTSSQSGSEFD